MAHNKGLLSSPEYSVLCQWYEYIENNVDIGLDLIGKYYFKNLRQIYYVYHFSIKILFYFK